jgi:hypothetical protein
MHLRRGSLADPEHDNQVESNDENEGDSQLSELEDADIISEFMDTQMGEFNEAYSLGDLLTELHRRKFLALSDAATEIIQKSTVA